MYCSYRILLDKEHMSVFLAFLRMLDMFIKYLFSSEPVALLVYSNYFNFILQSMHFPVFVVLPCDKALWNTFFDINYINVWISLDVYDKIFRSWWECGLKCCRFYCTSQDDKMFLFLMECSLFVITTLLSWLAALLHVFLNHQLSISLERGVSVQRVLTFLKPVSLWTFDSPLILQ